MNTLIVYSSQTGNTKKLAEAIYQAMSGDKQICPVSEAADPSGYDRVAVGFWLMAGKPDPAASEYLQKLGKAGSPSVFLFATHGARPDSDHVRSAFDHARTLLGNTPILGTFGCQGQLSAKIIEKIKTKPAPPAWFTEAPSAQGHPDDKDIKALQDLIRNLK